MSWTYITSLEDIPRALKRQAEMFKLSQNPGFDEAWKKVADDFDRFAEILAEDIVKYKNDCRRQRKRL